MTTFLLFPELPRAEILPSMWYQKNNELFSLFYAEYPWDSCCLPDISASFFWVTEYLRMVLLASWKIDEHFFSLMKKRVKKNVDLKKKKLLEKYKKQCF